MEGAGRVWHTKSREHRLQIYDSLKHEEYHRKNVIVFLGNSLDYEIYLVNQGIVKVSPYEQDIEVRGQTITIVEEIKSTLEEISFAKLKEGRFRDDR